MEPFTRILWFDQKTKQIWKRQIEQARRLYEAVEFATFEAGMRDVYVMHIYPEKISQQLEMIAKGKYVFLPILKSKRYSGFSHRHIPPKPGDPYFIYGVVARNLEDAERFKECSIGNKVDHVEIGRLLGYPECCTEFFDKVWNKKSIDPIYEAYGSETSIHPFCNQALRYFGIRLTPHLVCSPTCKRTIEMGKKWFKVAESIDYGSAHTLLKLLSMPFKWSCLNGCAIIDTELFRGVTNSDKCSEEKVVINHGWNKEL